MRQIKFVATDSHGQKKIRPLAIDQLIVYLEHAPCLYEFSITRLEDSDDMARDANTLMKENNGISILNLSRSLQDKYGPQYASMGAQEWDHVVRDYVQRHTLRYDIPLDEVVKWSIAAEPIWKRS